MSGGLEYRDPARRESSCRERPAPPQQTRLCLQDELSSAALLHSDISKSGDQQPMEGNAFVFSEVLLF